MYAIVCCVKLCVVPSAGLPMNYMNGIKLGAFPDAEVAHQQHGRS